ncbi:hypothetical protein [Stutzerimonas stutzeri]|uniref:hypothetical protein n=1 Tax=Stutzerimonas stutzeri TaxID=316 RepID=UPI001C614D5C|nr:hypothetical protein [Stutzerimonas stutzeri]
MAITAHSPTVKVVGTNGQISLGKQYAGRQVLVEEYEPGVWLVRTATVVPDNERWLHAPQAAADLQKAMVWSVAHAASDADSEDTLKRLGQCEKGVRYIFPFILWFFFRPTSWPDRYIAPEHLLNLMGESR